MNPDTLIASAGADLFQRGKLPADEDAASTAIANHAAAYLNGQAWFPLLSERDAAALFQRDDLGLGGLGSALKKAVKKVGKVVKTVAPLGVGVATGVMTGNPQAGIAAMSLTGAVIGGGPKAPGADVTVPATQQVPANYMPQTLGPNHVALEPMVMGIPQKYLPWLGLGAVALLVLTRR